MKKAFIAALVLVMLFAPISYAKEWVCLYCGRGASSNSRPAAGGCNKNPFGSNHEWDSPYGVSHHWVCTFCGWGANSDKMPPVNGCQKNEYGTFHRWVND